jgi:hypothetical protein
MAEHDDTGDDTPEQDDSRKPLSWRDLPNVVNLRDFAEMVGNEIEQIGISTRMALQSLFKLPFGPITGILGLFIIGIRSCLLVLVLFVFGFGIMLITLLRGFGLFSRKPDDD